MDNARRLGTLLSVGIDVAHHIVPHFLLPRLRHLIIDVVGVGFEFRDLLVGDIQTQFLLGLGKRNPQSAPCAEFHIGRKEVLHFLPGIAGTKRGFINVFQSIQSFIEILR